jgi:hypothetical protein
MVVFGEATTTPSPKRNSNRCERSSCLVIIPVLAIILLIGIMVAGVIYNDARGRESQLHSLDIFIAQHQRTLNTTATISCGKGTYPRRGLCAPDPAYFDAPPAPSVSSSLLNKRQQQERCPDISTLACSSFSGDALNANRSLVRSYLIDYATTWSLALLGTPGEPPTPSDDVLRRTYALCQTSSAPSSIYTKLQRELDSVRDRGGLARIMGLWASMDVPSVFDVLVLPEPRSMADSAPVITLVPQRRFFEQAKAAGGSLLHLSDSERVAFHSVVDYLRSLYFDAIPSEYRQSTLSGDLISYVLGTDASWTNLSRDLMPLSRLSEALLERGGGGGLDLAMFFSGLNEGLSVALELGGTRASQLEDRIYTDRPLAWAFRSDFFLALDLNRVPFEAWKKYLDVCLRLDRFKFRVNSAAPSKLMLPEDHLPRYEYKLPPPCQDLVRSELYTLFNKRLMQELEIPGAVLEDQRYLQKVFGDLVHKFQQMAQVSNRFSRQTRERWHQKLGAVQLLLGTADGGAQEEISRSIATIKTFGFSSYQDILLASRAARKFYELENRYAILFDHNSEATAVASSLVGPLDDFLLPSVRYYASLNAIVLHPMMLAPLLYPPASPTRSIQLLETMSRLGWYMARELARSVDRYSSNFNEHGRVSSQWLYTSEDLRLYDQLYASIGSSPLVSSPSECIAQRLGFCAVYDVLHDHGSTAATEEDLLPWMRQMFWNSVVMECGGAAQSINFCVRDLYLYRRAFECHPGAATAALNGTRCLDELFSAAPRL